MTMPLQRLIEIAGAPSPGLLHYAAMLEPDVLEFGGNRAGETRAFEDASARLVPALAQRTDNVGPVRFSVLLLDIQESHPVLSLSEEDAIRRILDEEMKKGARLVTTAPTGPATWLDGVRRAIACTRGGRRTLLLQGRTSRPPGWIAGGVMSAVYTAEPASEGVYSSVLAAGPFHAADPVNPGEGP